MAGVSRSAPSVTTPVAPASQLARSTKMSPMVPASGSPRASITSTSSGARLSMARRCAFWPAPSVGLQVLAHRHVAQRVGVAHHPLALLHRLAAR